MAFVSGLLLIDAQASALNNLGNIPGERFDNSVGVKAIRAKDGFYPYVRLGLQVLASKHPAALCEWLEGCARLSGRKDRLYRLGPDYLVG